jgi:hypothetical protein
MTAQVEILLFGRPEGLEVSSSTLFKGLEDSLYPSPGVLDASDEVIWRLQFLNQGGQSLQVLSCIRSMGSPTRGPGGFIGTAAVMAGQFEISASLTSQLLSELDRFVADTTNGVQFIASRMEGWRVPLEYTGPLQIRRMLYAPVGGKGSFIGVNLQTSRAAEQIEHSIRTNRLNGSTEAVFVSLYQGDRRDVVDLNQTADVLTSLSSEPSSSSVLDLEVEIIDLKEKIGRFESELVQAREQRALDVESQAQLKSDNNSLQQQLRQERGKQSSAGKNSQPRIGVWIAIGLVLGVLLGSGGVWLKNASDFDADSLGQGTIQSDSEVGKSKPVGSDNSKTGNIDLISILQERALNSAEFNQPKIQDALINLSYPEKTEKMLENRYASIQKLLLEADDGFDESKYCGPCIKYAIPEIQVDAKWMQSSLSGYDSKNSQVRQLMSELIQHTNKSPLFEDGTVWSITVDKIKVFSGKNLQAKEIKNACSKATLPGELDSAALVKLCIDINIYSFKVAQTQVEDKYSFKTWKLPKRD